MTTIRVKDRCEEIIWIAWRKAALKYQKSHMDPCRVNKRLLLRSGFYQLGLNGGAKSERSAPINATEMVKQHPAPSSSDAVGVMHLHTQSHHHRRSQLLCLFHHSALPSSSAGFSEWSERNTGWWWWWWWL